jgi:Fe-S-cluster-containing hydrogenase component 2
MPKKAKPTETADIFQLLTEAKKKEKKKKKTELLKPLELKEYFTEGSITINKKTCQGLECKLCIKACPTNALFWKAGEVGITEELCIYCGACVLSCIVDDCITITRKRPTGETERFNKPKDFAILQHNVGAKKRLERTQSIFPKPEDYLKRYPKKKSSENSK